MKIFFGILGAGAFGGALSWVYSITLGIPLALGGGYAALASILLGAGAALLGVYILANTDLRAVPRALTFAVLCGFAWQIIYENASSTLSRHAARQSVDSAANSTQSAAARLATASPARKDEVVKDLAVHATALLAAAKQADSEEAEKKAQSVSISALQALGQTPSPITPVASSAAEQIAVVALNTGNGAVAKKAIETLAATGGSKLATRDALKGIVAAAGRNNDEVTANLARSVLKHQVLTDVPVAESDQVIAAFESQGATVSKTLQPNGKYTVTGIFPDLPHQAADGPPPPR